LISVKAPSFDDSRWLSRLLAHVGEDSTAVANPSKPTRGRRVNHATTSYGSSARAVSFRLNFPLRLFAGRDAEAIFSAVSEHYGLDRSALAHRGDPHIARAVAAWLCRRHSEDPLRELAPRLGLSRADSVPNLTRRMDARLQARPQLADELQQIMARIEPETKNQV